MNRIARPLFLLTLFAAAMVGQSRTPSDDPGARALKGVVSDAAGKPVSGAVVQLKDTKSLQIRSFYTQADGDYHFAGLSTNVDYEVKASAQGSESRAKTLSVFDNRKVATINLKLK